MKINLFIKLIKKYKELKKFHKFISSEYVRLSDILDEITEYLHIEEEEYCMVLPTIQGIIEGDNQ